MKAFSLINGLTIESPVTLTSPGNYQMTNQGTVFVKKTIGQATTITLRQKPDPGMCAIVLDDKGDAATNPITILPFAGSGALIDGNASYSLNANYDAVILMWDGANWKVMADASAARADITILKTAALASTTFAANQFGGAQRTTFINTAVTPGNLTTRTAVQMIADFPEIQIGDSYNLRVINAGTSLLTILPGNGVALNGGMTLAAVTWRDFIVTYTSPTVVTITAIGTGPY